MKKQTVATKNVSLLPLRRIHWRRTNHCWCLLGTASPVYVALDLCYLSWLKYVLQQDGALAHAAISLAETLLRTGKLRFYRVFTAPKLAGLQYLGLIAAKGQCYSSPKMGALKWKPFGNCGLPKLGDVAAKLLHAQTSLREGNFHWWWL
jgi:hypothetical protein